MLVLLGTMLNTISEDPGAVLPYFCKPAPSDQIQTSAVMLCCNIALLQRST